MTLSDLPFAAEAGGVRLAVRLTPRASKNAVEGVIRGADGRAVLQVRVAAPPIEGAANTVLVAFLAQSLGLRKADIEIRSGDKARLKILYLAGDGGAIVGRLTAWVAAGSSRARGGG
ncbi:DUF167 domain-containing protein [Acidisoma cladoniae]|uniref:DUF167 domain-containing protein n=1 Tax=Acidisoma cladoniae TaxID=3040935 RepID=UPI00254CCF07|nr:DUF167 domain-containing protein [Acidisoma sp. PAMC 29798]